MHFGVVSKFLQILLMCDLMYIRRQTEMCAHARARAKHVEAYGSWLRWEEDGMAGVKKTCKTPPDNL